jgi:hypothetical protein
MGWGTLKYKSLMKRGNMKHLSLLVLAIFGVAFFANAAPKNPGNKLDPTRGYLNIDCNTEGAEVFVDSKKIGTTPIKDAIIVDPGKHTVKVKKKGYSDFAEVIPSPAGKMTEVKVELLAVAGYLVVDTEDKEKAQVYLDGKFLGDTKFEGEIGIGPHELEVRRLGYFDYRTKFIAKGGQEIPYQAALQKLPPELDPLVKKKPIDVPKFISTTAGIATYSGIGGVGAVGLSFLGAFLRAKSLACDGLACRDDVNENGSETGVGKR